ncbi:hypothetical protein PAXRUDRAFT_834545 [Paxillus rubicundulus Ve08.2h10]|uniref:Uncharacterized protein n=1 Tax=Paxillus rubicundulus Ve08.2h10 TaxID=930991 RepID=A0A0D0DJX9_9AGAM|nr:hypothetical protein PAXRUDRAFT_834545 [Paxillus rubicundulus Ve08.2h10]
MATLLMGPPLCRPHNPSRDSPTSPYPYGNVTTGPGFTNTSRSTQSTNYTQGNQREDWNDRGRSRELWSMVCVRIKWSTRMILTHGFQISNGVLVLLLLVDMGLCQGEGGLAKHGGRGRLHPQRRPLVMNFEWAYMTTMLKIYLVPLGA